MTPAGCSGTLLARCKSGDVLARLLTLIADRYAEEVARRLQAGKKPATQDLAGRKRQGGAAKTADLADTEQIGLVLQRGSTPWSPAFVSCFSGLASKSPATSATGAGNAAEALITKQGHAAST